MDHTILLLTFQVNLIGQRSFSGDKSMAFSRASLPSIVKILKFEGFLMSSFSLIIAHLQCQDAMDKSHFNLKTCP